MNFVLVFVIVILLSFPSSVSAKITSRVPPPLESSEEEATPEDYPQIIEALWQKAEEEPYNHEIYGALALFYDHIGDYKNLLEVTRLEVAYLPEDAEERDAYYGNLAMAFMLNGEWEQGKEWLDKADAVNADNFFNRSQSFHYFLSFKKDYSAAALELQRMDKLGGKEWDVYYEAYAMAMEENIDGQETVALFQEAVRLQPRSFKARRMLGTAIRDSSQKDYEAHMPLAMAEFRKALQLNPKYLPTYISIADTSMILGIVTGNDAHYQEALNWFNKAYAIDPQNLNLAYAMGSLFIYMRDYDKAIAKLEPLCRGEAPEDPPQERLAAAYNGKAYDFYQKGERLEEGLQLVEKALALQPKDGVILSTKAELLYKLGRLEEAYEHIQESIRLAPDDKDIQKDFKMIEAALGKDRK